MTPIAIVSIARPCEMFSEDSLYLSSFVSSLLQVIQSICQSQVAEKVNVDFADVVIAREFGVVWNVTSDCLNYVVSTFLSGNVTRLNFLSIVSSVFDPLGLVSPLLLLIGRQIVTELFVSGLLVLLTEFIILEQDLVQSIRFVWNPGSSSNKMEQGRSKWSTTSTHLDVRDVVDETRPRNRWKMVCVLLVSEDQLVRGARVKMKLLNKHSRKELDRPHSTH